MPKAFLETLNKVAEKNPELRGDPFTVLWNATRRAPSVTIDAATGFLTEAKRTPGPVAISFVTEAASALNVGQEFQAALAGENPRTTHRVLITGSRAIEHRDTVARAITSAWVAAGRRPIIVCHGTARGADRLAGIVARQNRSRATEEQHPAEWKPEGPKGRTDMRAGFERNQLMVNLGAEICLAFLKEGEENNGTRDCISRARAANIPVIETWEPATPTV